MTTPTVIAYDPGFGFTKLAIGLHPEQVSVIQSAATRPVEVGMAAQGAKVSIRPDSVWFDGMEYVYGAGAWRWGHTTASMDYTSLTSPERRALLYAAISDVAPAEPLPALDDVRLYVGLPVPLLQNPAEAQLVYESLKQLKGEHHWVGTDGRHRMNITRVYPRPQPLGAYANWAYTDELKTRAEVRHSEIAVLDIGTNTLDLFVIERGEVSPVHLGGAKVGVRRLLDTINTNGYSTDEATDMLRAGRLRPSSNDLDSWLNEVMAAVERNWPSLKRFTAVIPTGGGAVLLKDRLTSALAAKGAALYWPTDPVTANAVGLWKHGAASLG